MYVLVAVKASPKEAARVRSRTRWHLAYLLLKNPNLQVLRKHYIDEVNRALQEEAALRKEQKLAKKYKNTTNSVQPAPVSQIAPVTHIQVYN